MTVEVLQHFDHTEYDSDGKNGGEMDLADAANGSPIQEFYQDQTVFITGATGFIGTLLVEKLLRCCPQVRKVILLMRGRRSQSVEERVRDFFSEDIFDGLKLADPNYHEKVDIVRGQLDEDDLGLAPNDERLLTSQTTVVFHIAATVRFDEHIRQAYNINVRGTEQLLSLAKRMPRLKSFVHVSTAYCNCDHQLIGERFYEPSVTPGELASLVGSASDEEIALLTAHLIGEKPNTYTLTKAAAEDLVRQAMHELPICVFRPSIVMPTLSEPLPCWFKGFNSVLALSLMAGLGISRVALCDLDIILDIVPADRTINALAALAWYQTACPPPNKSEDARRQSEDSDEKSFAQNGRNRNLCPSNKESKRDSQKWFPNSGRHKQEIVSSQKETTISELHEDNKNKLMCSLEKDIDEESFAQNGRNRNVCPSNKESKRDSQKWFPNSGRHKQEILSAQKETKTSELHEDNKNKLMCSLEKDIDEESCTNRKAITISNPLEKTHLNATQEEKKLCNDVLRSQHKDSSGLVGPRRKDVALRAAENKITDESLNKIDCEEAFMAHEGNLKVGPQADRRIFNYVSYQDNPLTMRGYIWRSNESWMRGEESNSFCVWTNHAYHVKQTFLYFVLFYLLHTIPAVVISVAERLQRRQPMILSTFRKVIHYTKSIGYFCLNGWVFENANARALADAIAAQDCAGLFDASMANFEWGPFIDCYPRSIALYMTKERTTKKHYRERMVYIYALDYWFWMTVKVVGVYFVLRLVAGLINKCCVF